MSGPSSTEAGTKRKSVDNEPHAKTTKKSRPNYKDTITVLAGEDEEEFIVHMDTICSKSEFFTAACSKQWATGREKTVPLPEIEPASFKLYAHWAYTDKIDLTVVDPALVDLYPFCSQTGLKMDQQPTQEGFFRHLIDLYVTADVLLDTTLQNAVMDKLVARRALGAHHFEWSMDNIDYLWEHTKAESGLRNFALDLVTYKEAKTLLLDYDVEDYPDGFFFDFAMRQLQTRDDRSDRKRKWDWEHAREYHTLQDSEVVVVDD